jgi:hypothetical protein
MRKSLKETAKRQRNVRWLATIDQKARASKTDLLVIDTGVFIISLSHSLHKFTRRSCATFGASLLGPVSKRLHLGTRSDQWH